MFNRLKKIINRPSIAIDLGTANTRIFSSDIGQVMESPSTVRPSEVSKNNSISGDYISYLNSKISYNPLRGGVIVDIYNAINLLKPLLKETRRGFRQPISLASAPTDTSSKERELLVKAIIEAGASQVAIIPEVWAAAIGSGIDVTSENAQALIDIGEGVTDLAIIRDGQLLYTAAIRTACSDLQKAVRSAIVSRHKVYVCGAEAERLTNTISIILMGESKDPRYVTIQGNDIFKGNDVTIDINENDIVSAMNPVINRILKMVEFNIRRLPNSVYDEITESGICLSGGGALISGIDSLIKSSTNLDVRIASDPTHSVINGEIETLNYWQGHKKWWKNIFWPDL
ncbi:MAG: rod shape-determining protein [Deltaproteobacteria bacterium]|nr:rod shape-determining protein [Deltaproteobacteria bacterium]